MKEIERKFKVVSDNFKSSASSASHIRQWYLSRHPERTVRVRIRDNNAYLTIKSSTVGIERDEFEYPIPVEDALQMLPMANGIVIDKTRWIVNYADHIWEIDEFHGCYEGLLIAEIELENSDEKFMSPEFIGQEVSNDPRFFNSALAAGETDISELLEE